MKLYHGTSEPVARIALTDGLRPRGSAGVQTTWEENPSREDMVYLTTAYAGYFASNASAEGERWAIIEVDTELLRSEGFHPDEDFLEQATRQQRVPEGSFWAGLRRCRSMEARTKWYRENLEAFQDLWTKSVEGLGNCAYAGTIPPEAFTRVAVFDPSANPRMASAVDPSISILNYQFCGEKYRAMTRWMVGHDVNPRSLIDGGSDMPFDPAREYDLNNPALREIADTIRFFQVQYQAVKESTSGHPGVSVLRATP